MNREEAHSSIILLRKGALSIPGFGLGGGGFGPRGWDVFCCVAACCAGAAAAGSFSFFVLFFFLNISNRNVKFREKINVQTSCSLIFTGKYFSCKVSFLDVSCTVRYK